MRRWKIIAPVIIVPLTLLIGWIASNTEWVEIQVPMPPKGEARINPFYAAERFAQALGARATWDHAFTAPPPHSVVVLSDWHWTLSRSRREAIEHWVESGGRLVLEGMLMGGEQEFAGWSRIRRVLRNPSDSHKSREFWNDDECASFQEERDGVLVSGAARMDFSVCNLDSLTSLVTGKKASWALRDSTGSQAVRVPIGAGSVTVINATPFRQQHLFDGDHGRLFVAATELRRGDEVHFLLEGAQLSLLALAWHYGAPVVALVLTMLAFALWRGAVRFGPLAPPPPSARRSLAEQIRGTGQFALRYGGGRMLHAALVRAVEEAVLRRVKSYTRLPTDERLTTLAELTGFDRRALARAIDSTDSRNAQDLRRTLALLEAARRRALIEHGRSHGTR